MTAVFQYLMPLYYKDLLSYNKRSENNQTNIALMEISAKTNDGRRRIRSYTLRTGRLTTGQQRALNELWPVFGIPADRGLVDLDTLFGNQLPVTLEIGFGNGDNLVTMAARRCDQNFLGIEVHEPGVGHCLMQIAKLGLGNVRVVRHDAVEFIAERLPDDSLARINLFFPDPWHKKRHHKRRIVQQDFVQLLSQKLQIGGVLHIATDWPDYAEHIAATLASSPIFAALQEPPADRITTRFDMRGQRLGHSNWECAWCKRNKLPITD